MTPMILEEDRAADSAAPPPSAAPRPESGGAAPVLARFSVYTVVLLGTIGGLVRLLMVPDKIDQAIFREQGLVETLQVGMLLALAAGLAVCGWRWRRSVHVLGLLAAFAAVGGIREMDWLLDHWIPLLSWKLPAGAIVAVAIAFVVRRRKAFQFELSCWVRTPAFGVLWAGFIVGVFAQVFGQGDLWETVMGDRYERAFKRIIEESAEMFGYMLLLIGGIESAFQAAAFEQSACNRDEAAANSRIMPE